MATRKRARAKESHIAFDALSIEGGVLSPEWLARVASVSAGRQTEAEYRIPKGLSLRDEIGRYWRIAQACWRDFAAGRVASADARVLSKHFVTSLLRDAFGFASLAELALDEVGERSYPIGLAALGKRVPVVVGEAPVSPVVTTIDAPDDAFADEGRRRSAFGLAQEYLNAAEHAVWGIATDGCTLRILRDNASLTRPAWIEADLQRIFVEERYADFAALWLLLHESRFGQADHPPHDCALETWRTAGREEGVVARDKLRFGVEDALLSLGQGFLAHPANQEIRAQLEGGALPAKDYFNQLLRLVYRIIFLLTVEERALLHPDGVPAAVKTLYAEGYGLRRLRERAVKRSAHDRHADLWEGLKIVFRGVEGGEERLGLPALAGIFASRQCAPLDAAKLENRALLSAVFRLAWIRDDGALARVNWRDMGPEELGSVYESLLELVPQITKDGRQFAFATGGETKGNARKTSGSYYTPDSLVQVLLDSALEPVITDAVAKNPGHEVEALLKLSIVDPACGSGHFLLSAARRLAAHVARLQANGSPSAAEYRHALRQVVGKCIYGVDLNPMAVELCKVSLWMEAVEPGLPLTFLNSHIQHGNALLGTTPELMARGIPDAAWETIEGDDKKTASALKKRNKAGASGQRGMDALWSKPADAGADIVTQAVTALESASDADAQALAQKERRWDGILGSDDYRRQKLIADAWCAAFVWPKQPGEFADAAPTNELWRALRDGQGRPPALTTKVAHELADQYRFFHWYLQFPQVFTKGGFDVVLGNPPWESSDLMKVEFFAARLPGVGTAATTEERLRIIERSIAADPRLASAWTDAQRRSAGEAHFTSAAGRYPLTSVGKLNTYRTFAELSVTIVAPRGRTGVVLKTGIVNAQDNQEFFASLLRAERVQVIRDFVNTEELFRDVVANERFCTFVITGTDVRVPVASFMFCLTAIGDMANRERLIELTSDELARLNPNDLSVPPLTSARDKALLVDIHRRIPVLVDEPGHANPMRVRYARGHLNSSTDSGLFAKNDYEALSALGQVDASGKWEGTHRPLIEGKLIGSFNHRFGTFLGVPRATRFGKKAEARDLTTSELNDPATRSVPRFWLSQADAAQRIAAKNCNHQWLLTFRHVCRAIVDARTAQVAIVPCEPLSDSCAMFLVDDEAPRAAVAASLVVAAWTSFVGDYVLRQKLYGPALTKAIAQQLPAPTEAFLSKSTVPTDAVRFVVKRVLELSYTSWDLEAFARDVGLPGPPFRWDSSRRFLLRCELDAAFFHLYGLSRDDTDYVLETFPIVKRKEEAAHGEYRSKRVTLEIYDAMGEAGRTGTPYQTRLDPPPADPRVAHPESTRPEWAKKRET